MNGHLANQMVVRTRAEEVLTHGMFGDATEVVRRRPLWASNRFATLGSKRRLGLLDGGGVRAFVHRYNAGGSVHGHEVAVAKSLCGGTRGEYCR